MISFFRGHPSDDLLPAKQVAEATTRVLQPKKIYEDGETRHPLQYGTDPGAEFVRKVFCEFTNRTLRGNATPDCLNLTNGASYGAASALQQLCSSNTKQAFLVSPTYFLINNVFKDFGFENKMTAVLEDEHGLDLAQLEANLKRLAGDKPDPAFVQGKKGAVQLKKFQFVMYLVPTFSNPGGVTLSTEQRKKLLALAREYDMLLLCDEVYEWLDFSGTTANHPPTLVTLDRDTLPEGALGNVVANFTMSKILGPGLRVGWQETATPELSMQLSQTGANISGGTPAQLNTFVVADLILSGDVDKIIDEVNEAFATRAEVYTKALKELLPEGTLVNGGNGGYFYWVTLPEGYDVAQITATCAENGIIVAPGSSFEVEGDSLGWGRRCFRFCLSYYDGKTALPALEKFADIVKKSK